MSASDGFVRRAVGHVAGAYWFYTISYLFTLFMLYLYKRFKYSAWDPEETCQREGHRWDPSYFDNFQGSLLPGTPCSADDHYEPVIFNALFPWLLALGGVAVVGRLVWQVRHARQEGGS
ncbi:hypothetical protein [Salininema proteolyticum]|uniref:Uncharacterized protein n=1 Tax=Salininema proteolyticum TaxID=1607685 RepID=A0ABV8U3B9_9ACTN